jgi:hypothetical protein
MLQELEQALALSRIMMLQELALSRITMVRVQRVQQVQQVQQVQRVQQVRQGLELNRRWMGREPEQVLELERSSAAGCW